MIPPVGVAVECLLGRSYVPGVVDEHVAGGFWAQVGECTRVLCYEGHDKVDTWKLPDEEQP